VATGDQATVKRFIASSPGFKKGFKLTQPRIYVKQDGKWIVFRLPGNRTRST